jgi:hypothetical protein
VSYFEDVADAEYAALTGHVCDVLKRQHVAADKMALKVIVMKPMEDFGKFLNSLGVLTRRAYGHVYKPPQVEEHAGEVFVRGLNGPLRQRMRKDFPENLDAALALARNLKAIGVSRVAAMVAPVAPTASGAKPTVGAGMWGGSSNSGSSGLSQGSHGSQSFGGRSQGSSGSSQGARSKTEIVCWFCSNKGHIKVECRNKAAANAAAKNSA